MGLTSDTRVTIPCMATSDPMSEALTSLTDSVLALDDGLITISLKREGEGEGEGQLQSSVPWVVRGEGGEGGRDSQSPEELGGKVLCELVPVVNVELLHSVGNDDVKNIIVNSNLRE